MTQFEMASITEKTKDGKGIKWLVILIFSSPAILASLITVLLVFSIAFIVTSVGQVDQKELGGVSLSETGKNEIPAEFIPAYKAAAETYGINWILLAAIHKEETNFGKYLAVSSAGAVGHFQFMKCTWVGWGYPGCGGKGNANIPDSQLTDTGNITRYGGYGVDSNVDGKADPWNIEDSAYAAAKYLAASGASDGNIRAAIYAYNHADWYVQEVMDYFNSYATGYSESGTVDIRGDKAFPVTHTKNITSEFGMRDGKLHKGIDIAGGNDLGKPIVAFIEGDVIYSQWNTGGYGYLVVIQHANNMKTYYAHMQQQGITVGTHVRAGQVIGYMGTTGDSTGVHLHFEIRINDNPTNPRPYLAEWIGN